MKQDEDFTYKELFELICQKYNEVKEKSSMKLEEAYFLIFSLNHLREWIYPGYRPSNMPKNDEEKKFQIIYESSDFQIINDLANHTKHLKNIQSGSIRRYQMIDDWPSLDDVGLISIGHVEYKVEGKELVEVIKNVIHVYNQTYFNLNLEL